MHILSMLFSLRYILRQAYSVKTAVSEIIVRNGSGFRIHDLSTVKSQLEKAAEELYKSDEDIT